MRQIAVLFVAAPWGLLSAAGPLLAQAPPATQPAAADAKATSLTATVIEVRGDVEHAPGGTEDEKAWKACKLKDVYASGEMIRTGLKGSAVKLQFGEEEPYTVAMIERYSLASIDQHYRTASDKVVRLGLGYGAIRAGVADEEGGLRSDFEIDSPVATLSKRGTWGFRMQVFRTGEFNIALANRGLVEALKKATGQRRRITPGQYVTQSMRRWVENTLFDRSVPVQDLFGLTGAEITFNVMHGSGLGINTPGGGRAQIINLTGREARDLFIQQIERRQQQNQNVVQPRPGVVRRPEGSFGTGAELPDVVHFDLEPNSDIVRKGYARPGRFSIRSSALPKWVHDRLKRR